MARVPLAAGVVEQGLERQRLDQELGVVGSLDDFVQANQEARCFLQICWRSLRQLWRLEQVKGAGASFGVGGSHGSHEVAQEDSLRDGGAASGCMGACLDFLLLHYGAYLSLQPPAVA
jgi:hypothetical protein